MYRFTNLTDLNLTKNEISYIEDGAFAGQANLQVMRICLINTLSLTQEYCSQCMRLVLFLNDH